MATLTQTVHKPLSKPFRTYDYLYDPHFVVSSDKDHAKAGFEAHTSIDRIKYVPEYKTMFSCLRHRPRNRVTLDTTDAVPPHVYQGWRGYADKTREAIERYKKFNYDPSVNLPVRHYETVCADGRDRHKFFRRPIIPFMPHMPPSVVLAPTRVDPMAPPSEGDVGHTLAEPAMKSVLTQTDYRDSETQTDPYSPEYVVRPGCEPEVLTLAMLCYGQGLPAGLAEVEMIKRAREKRAWEATLPPLNDLSQLEKRQRMMGEQERKEWAFRESEIEELQHERFGLLKKMLKQREADHQALNERRMEHLWSRKQVDKERKFRRFRSDHVKALRKLTAAREKVEGTLERRNIIREYTKFDSQVYAPVTRVGVYLDSGAERYETKSSYITTLPGLLELEEFFPVHITKPTMKPPSRAAKVVGNKARKKEKLGKVLDQVYEELKAKKLQGMEPPKPLRFLEKVEKPIPRPPTPTIDTPEKGEEETELALILLQRILRGRAIQTKMFEGKERRKWLIDEVRTTHALQSPEQKAKKQEREAVLSKQRHKAQQNHTDEVVADVTESGAAHLLGQQLDFLNKELERLREERRIHAFVLLAERERRMKEAEESGRRQREERLRRTEDEVFKQMMRVHHGTVESYLEDVILQSLEKTADEQSRKEIQIMAKKINQVAQEFQHTELSGRELAAELVYSFLLPEVEKQTIREQVQRDQRKHLLAAHRVIYKEAERVMEKEGGDGGEGGEGGGGEKTGTTPEGLPVRPVSHDREEKEKE